MRKKSKRLELRVETIRDMALVVGGIPIPQWPDPPIPTALTCRCPPSPTNSCDGCTIITF